LRFTDYWSNGCAKKPLKLILSFISIFYVEFNSAFFVISSEPEGNIFQVDGIPEAKNSDSSSLVLHEEQVNGMFLSGVISALESRHRREKGRNPQRPESWTTEGA
jgi:hypothetical protein